MPTVSPKGIYSFAPGEQEGLLSSYNAANSAYQNAVQSAYKSMPGAPEEKVYATAKPLYDQALSQFEDLRRYGIAPLGDKGPTYWSGNGGGFGLKKALGIALPIAGSFLLPGIGTALGGALGTSAAVGSGLAGAGLGALTGKLTGGNVLQSALLGGAGGYLGGGGFSDITKSLGLGDLLGSTSLSTEAFGPNLPSSPGSFGPSYSPPTGIAALGRGITSFLDDPVAGITSKLEDTLDTKNLLKSGLKFGLGSLLQKDNSGGYGAIQNAANTAAGYYQPFLQSGTAANAQLADLYGLNGADAQKAAYAGFQTSPGYEFSKDQGIRALDASAAKRGMLLSGNQVQDVQKFGTGLANQEFQQYLDNLVARANQGQSAAAGVGQNQVDAATAYASMKANKANNSNQLLSGLLSGIFG